MGRRQKVTVVVVVCITFQILSSHCMPRNQSKLQLKNHAKHIKSSHIKRTKKEALCNNLAATNSTTSLQKIRFPDVEYPSNSNLEDYYRFLNEYPSIQFKPQNYLNMSNTLSQAQKCKMDTKYKRKLDMATNVNANPNISTLTKYDPLPQPYCSRRSDFFPEVEYPLSARDMWIPKYWSRLQDGKIERDLCIDRPTNTCQSNHAPASNYDSDFETAPLDNLIEPLSTNKFQSPTSDNNLKLPISKEMAIGFDNIVSNNTNSIKRVDDLKFIPKKNFFDNIKKTIISTQKNASNSNPSERYGPYYNITPSATDTTNDISLTPLHVEKGPLKNFTAMKSEGKVFSFSVLETEIMNNGSSKTNRSEIQMPSSSRPIDKTATEALPTTMTTSNPIRNVFTPLDYYAFNDITTAAPFESMTSPMSAIDILTSQPAENAAIRQSDLSFSQDTIGTTTPIPVLTTNPQYNYYDYSTDNCPQNVSHIGDVSKDWLLNSSDSYITCQFPEDSDDWIIYVDNENTSSVGNCSVRNCSLVQKSSTNQVVNSSMITALDDTRNRSREEPKNTHVDLLMPNSNKVQNATSMQFSNTTEDGQINEYAPNEANSIFYIDDTMASFTEMPYDLVNE